MKYRIITDKNMLSFEKNLKEEEKTRNTIEKYKRDMDAFRRWLGKNSITKDCVIAYKQYISDSGYKTRSVNSMIASLNSFFIFMGWDDLKVKAMKFQRDLCCEEQKNLTQGEYSKLCRSAERKNNKRLSLIIQTICSTGIRVSELEYITVDAVLKGEAVVTLKGKTRNVLLVKDLQKKLLRYIDDRKISSGPVFVTKNGKPINRSNIWREMKSLCADAGVDEKKVFPHNLRHLFARIYYNLDKDIARLADVLGHSSIDTTRIYISATRNEHRRHMENMHLII